jgi:hypothetical protein
MTRQTLRLVIISLACACLIACASWNSPSTTKKSMCNMLKSDLVFGGATSDTRQAEIQTAEQPLEQKNYDQNNC